MSRRINDQFELTADEPTQLLPLLIASGFTQTPMASELMIRAGDHDLYQGTDDSVSPTNGDVIYAGESATERAGGDGIIDLTQVWLICASNTTFYVRARGNG